MRTLAVLCHSNNILWPTGNAAIVTYKYTDFLKLGSNLCSNSQFLSNYERISCFGAMCACAISGESLGLQSSEDLAVSKFNSGEDSTGVSLRNERHRRRRKKHGNKGRVPWNKGIKHSAETRALIKERTIEALRDPQVRIKMAEHSRPHSDENKAKISVGLLRNWEKRLTIEKLKERFYLSWAFSIAEAGRKGGTNQRELKWNQCEMWKQQITLQQFPCRRKTSAKSVNVSKKPRQRVSLENKKVRLKARKKLPGNKGSSTSKTLEKRAKDRLSLKQKLTKIRTKKSNASLSVHLAGALVSSNPAWDKLDMELVRGSDSGVKLSLADQIKAAKSKRNLTL